MKQITKSEVVNVFDQAIFGALFLMMVTWFPVQVAIALLRAWGVEVGH